MRVALLGLVIVSLAGSAFKTSTPGPSMPVGGKGIEHYLGAADSRDAGSTQSSAYVAPKIHRCFDNRAGLEYYRTVYERYRSNMNPHFVGAFRPAAHFSCKYIHYLAGVMRERVTEARVAYEKFRRDLYVPAFPWFALARCEQWSSSGVQWTAYSTSYEGGYGFTHDAWDQWKEPGMPAGAHQAPPGVQTRVAMRIQADVGWGAWPSCSIRLGLR